MLHRVVRLTALLLTLLLPAAGNARDIFVDNVAGDDRHDGGSPTNLYERGPCRTLRRGLELAQWGDRVILANHGEPYHESVTLEGKNNSGSQFGAFALLGNGAVLSGQLPVPDRQWRHLHDEYFAFQPERKSYQQFFIDNLPVERVYAKTPLAMPPLKFLQWTLYDGEIIFRAEPRRMPQTYHCTYAALPVGLTLYNIDNVIISDLVVEGFQLDGISAIDNCRRVSLVNVTSRGNGRAGVNVAGSSRVGISNCLIGNNGAAQVRTEGFCEVYLSNNDLLENPAPALLNEGGTVLKK